MKDDENVAGKEGGMSKHSGSSRRRAQATALLLLLAGSLAGIAIDRLLLLPRPAAAAPLTAEGMADELDLGPAEAAHLRALLDSMHMEVLEAASQAGPAGMLASARSAHARIEAALPPEMLPKFRVWVEQHHRHLMERVDASGGHRHNGEPALR
jgi:hypothetical protein